MRTQIFLLDSFTTRRFKGNPAAVVTFEKYPDGALMQDIAAENNLSETAFIVRDGDDYGIRWFTPTLEVPLCGHATLASAAVVMERIEPGRTHVIFHSASGPLAVRRTGNEYAMDFPARLSAPVDPPDSLAQILGAGHLEVVADQFNYLVRLESAQLVRELKPNLAAIAALDRGGLIVTASGAGDFDFTSGTSRRPKAFPKIP